MITLIALSLLWYLGIAGVIIGAFMLGISRASTANFLKERRRLQYAGWPKTPPRPGSNSCAFILEWDAAAEKRKLREALIALRLGIAMIGILLTVHLAHVLYVHHGNYTHIRHHHRPLDHRSERAFLFQAGDPARFYRGLSLML
jgi:hypothetical protein